MDSHELKRLLEAVRLGDLSTEDAAHRLRTPALEETGGFATVDLHRRVRCGFPEVIFGQGKTTEQVVAILGTMIRHGSAGSPPGSRPRPARPSRRPSRRGNIIRLPGRSAWPGPTTRPQARPRGGRHGRDERSARRGGGPSHGRGVGVRGRDGGGRGRRRHPPAAQQACRRSRGADAIVCVAGMEGALPSAVGGLVDCPVIAVPTSIGYGANFGGLAALLGMLNSCSSNVVVVNIDAGFNGGHVAGLIARRAGQARAGSAGGDGERPEAQGTRPKAQGGS